MSPSAAGVRLPMTCAGRGSGQVNIKRRNITLAALLTAGMLAFDIGAGAPVAISSNLPATNTSVVTSLATDTERPLKIVETITNAKARQKPSKDSPVVKTIKEGSRITIVKVQGNWSKTQGGLWILNDTIATLKVIPAPTKTTTPKPVATKPATTKPVTPTSPAPSSPPPAPISPSLPVHPNKVLLTFDDCIADPQRLISTLDYAAANNIGLMIFPTGECMDSYARRGYDLPQLIRERGHWVGNHTYSHADLTKLSREAIANQIKGGPSSSILRPPYGASNATVRSVAESLGMQLMFWSIDTNDWQSGHNSQVIADYVIRNAKPGSTVLMHLQHQGFNDNTLYMIQSGLKYRGIELCSPAPRSQRPTPVRIPSNFCS